MFDSDCSQLELNLHNFSKHKYFLHDTTQKSVRPEIPTAASYKPTWSETRAKTQLRRPFLHKVALSSILHM